MTSFDHLLSNPKGSRHTQHRCQSVSKENPVAELIPEPTEMGSALGYHFGLMAITGHCAARVFCCPLKYKQGWGAWHVLACLFSVLLADVFP